MKVELLHYTPLWVAAKAIRTCWNSHDKSDSKYHLTGKCCNKDCEQGWQESEYDYCKICGEQLENLYKPCGKKDKELIERVGNKNKHKSTLEHLVYTFDIDGISRACLQELARHRMASLSVKSTRYTLKELRDDEGDFYRDESVNLDKIREWCVLGDRFQFRHILRIAKALTELREAVKNPYGATNDQIKYIIPEAFKTSLVWTINARSLQNFLELRTSESALWEIRDLANTLFDNMPYDHKYLFNKH